MGQYLASSLAVERETTMPAERTRPEPIRVAKTRSKENAEIGSSARIQHQQDEWRHHQRIEKIVSRSKQRTKDTEQSDERGYGPDGRML
jgi:hypothetical protein